MAPSEKAKKLGEILKNQNISAFKKFVGIKANKEYIKITKFPHINNERFFFEYVIDSKLNINTRFDFALSIIREYSPIENKPDIYYTAINFIGDESIKRYNINWFNNLDFSDRYLISSYISRNIAVEWINLYKSQFKKSDKNNIIYRLLDNQNNGFTKKFFYNIIVELNIDIVDALETMPFSQLVWDDESHLFAKKLLDLSWDRKNINDIIAMFGAAEYYPEFFMKPIIFNSLTDDQKKYVINKLPLAKKLRDIRQRKYREKISKNDYVYKWEKICSGKIKISFRDFFQYVLDVAMVLVDIKNEKYTRNTVKYILLKRYRDTKFPPKRRACIDIIDMINSYSAYLKNIECTNSLLTEESLDDIPIGQLVTFTENDQTYCFTVDEMNQMNRNPYTRELFSRDLVEKVKNMSKNKEWVYDKNKALREEFMKENIKYSTLWNKLSIKDYPISETSFREMSIPLIKRMYSIIKQNSRNQSGNNELSEINSHNEFVDSINKFIGNQNEANFDTKKVLVNEIMRRALNNDLDNM